MISFRDWMEICVREYYESDFRKDFFTAPELDKIFGYTLANYIADIIRDFENPLLLELGGGSGALAYDILTYLRKEEPKIYERSNYFIYEFSQRLIKLQRERLKEFEGKVFWTNSLFPMEGVIFSNEFFDCLPVHVVRKGKELFIEDGKEVWGEISNQRIKEVIKRMGYENLLQVVEIGLDCIDFLQRVGENLLRGYHIVIDYGYTTDEIERFPEGTILGYKSHRIYSKPSEGMDISAYVNFSLLEEYGKDFGLEKVSYLKLRDFLIQSSIFTKELEKLSQSELPEDIERLSRLKTMLISMGDRFKVLIQRKL